jgi:LPS sulfotransferase NodH
MVNNISNISAATLLPKSIILPVIIVSGQRTGSTILLQDIQSQFNLEKMFNEPGTSEQYDEFLSYIKTNNNYIVKFHAHHYNFYQDLKSIIDSNKCFLIRIQRKDIVAQCASLYIARKRKFKFIYNNPDPNDSIFMDKIDIDPEEIRRVINDICDRNKILKEFPAKFDADLYYEDLKFSDDIIKTPKPENYLQLKKIIEMFLDSQIGK